MQIKHLFALALIALVAASFGVRSSMPNYQTDRPVIYWVTDKNPARDLQVQRFHEWLVDQGHVDEKGQPIVELRLDMGNSDNSKKIIQSVSGVGGDLMDTNAASMRLLQAMGVLTDLTEDAKEMGFGLDKTFPAIADDLSVDGRQYRYPANVFTSMTWVNPALLRQYGLEPPSYRWTWDDFEELGVAFRDAANPPGTSPSDRKFICAPFGAQRLMQTNGISSLNETLTASDLDDPRYIEALETYKRWIYDLNIMPTPDDVAATATEQGYGGGTLQLFGRGQYAMFSGGRYHLIQLRRFPQLQELSVVEPPHNELPVTSTGSRGVVLYKGSKHPELAKLFLEFLASESYNMTILEDADAMPPNPVYTETEAYERPPSKPGEWGLHAPFRDANRDIAVTEPLSPYILPTILQRERGDKEAAFWNGRLTAEQAARGAAEQIDRRIAQELERKPEMRERYKQDVELQRRIDERKANGQPIPHSWIKNPFYRHYYAHLGMLIEDEPTEAGE
ncbi:MAG: extracellular solute-binding protein [Planctomycetota bacterium]